MSLVAFIESVFMAAPDVSDSISDDLLNPPDVTSLCNVCPNNIQLTHHFPDLSLSTYTTVTLPLLRQRLTNSTFRQGKNRENALDGRLKDLSPTVTNKFNLL